MAVSKKISDLPSLAGAQTGSDLLTAVDVSQPAATENVKSTIDLFFGNVPSRTLINAPAATTPTTPYFGVRTPADLALTADTERVGIQLGGDTSFATVTRQFTAGGGAFGTQREIVAVAPTYSATGAETIAKAATFAVTGAPAAGANMTLTNSYAFWVQSGKTQLDGNETISPAARTGSAPIVFQVVTPADTALTAGTENILNQIGGDSSQASVTRTFATGALTTQRENVVVAPTYAFAGGSTITTAATFTITNQPQAGANATLTNAYALWIQAGKTELDGVVTVAPAARLGSTQRVFQVVTPADTALTASTESILNQFGGSTAQATVTRQFATGALTTQRENLFVAPTYGAVGASTITTAATVAISNAPQAGTNATITNALALWVQAGLTRFDGQTVVNVSSSQAFAVGPNSLTNPSFQVVTNVASAATGISITGRAAGAGVTIAAISSGSNEALAINALGTGSLTFQAGLSLITSLGKIQTRAGNGATPSSDSLTVGGLYYSNTSVVGNVGGGTDDLQVKSVSANVFGEDGDSMLYWVAGKFANNANNKTVSVAFAGTTFTSIVATGASATDQTWTFIGQMIRINSTSVRILVIGILVGNAAASATQLIVRESTVTATLSNANDFKCTASGTSDNDITQTQTSLWKGSFAS